MKPPNYDTGAEWLSLLGVIVVSILVIAYAPETMLIIILCGPVAVALAGNYGPPQPIWSPNRKDR